MCIVEEMTEVRQFLAGHIDEERHVPGRQRIGANAMTAPVNTPTHRVCLPQRFHGLLVQGKQNPISIEVQNLHVIDPPPKTLPICEAVVRPDPGPLERSERWLEYVGTQLASRNLGRPL